MSYQQRENTGSLFPNDRKTADNQPDFKGTALINGVTYEIGAWKKTSTTGKEFTSLSFKVKSAVYDVSGTYPKQADPKNYPPPPDDSSLPF